jgi:hypothetical protein
MSDKREWHKPKFQLLDASATAQADTFFLTDDSTNDDGVFVPGDAQGVPVPGGADAS